MDQRRNMEVMKAGYLKKNISANTYKKQYKKFYFVLKTEIENSSKKTLEYFKDENSCVIKEPKGVCNLYSQYNVHIKLKQERKFIFEIVGVDKSHELMTTDETTGKEWVELLTEGLVIQIFSVIKMHYPPSAQNYVKDMKGTVLLKIDECCVTLLSNNGPAMYWEFPVIRKCKMNDGLVILDVGKKSITGEGEFYFDTSDPKRLYHVLDRAVRERAKKRAIVPNTNAMGDYPLMEKRLNSHRIDNKYDTNDTNKTGKIEPNNSTYNHLSHVHDHLAKPSTPLPSCKNTFDLLFPSTRIVTQQRSDPQIAPFLNNTELSSGKSKITSSAVSNHDTKKNNKTGNLEPNDSTYDHLSHAPGHLAKPSTSPPSCKNINDSLLCSTRMVAQQRSDPQIAPFLNNKKLLNGKTKIKSSTVNNHDTDNTNKAGMAEPNDSIYDHLSHVPNHLAKPSTPPPSSGNTYDSLFSSTKMVTQQESESQIALFLNNTKVLSDKTKITWSAVNSHDTNKTDKTENVEPNHSTYDHLSHVPDHLAKPSTPLLSSKNTYDSLFSSTRMTTQRQSDPQIAPFLNNRKLLNDKTKITSSAVNNHDTNKTVKAENVEPDHSTYDHLSHVPDHLAKPRTPPPSCKNINDSLLCSTRMVAQQRSDPQIAPFLNNTKLLNGKTKITSSTVNNHDTDNTNNAGMAEPNDSIYDHLSHVPNHLAKPSTPPPSSGNTYDSLFSSTKMVTQQKSEPQIALFLNNTKVLSDKAKITWSAVNNHDTNKTDKTENVEPNHSTYDHLLHVPDHLAKPSTPPLSSKNTYDSLFSSTRMATQRQSDPQIAPFLNNRNLLNDKTKITSSAVNNNDTNKTDKAENVEPDHSTYDHLSHAPDHLAKPRTPPPSSKNTNDSLYSSIRMVTQQKSDPQTAPFLNNTKLLSCKTVASSAVTPPATPTTLESIYVQIDLCQTSNFQKPIPPSLRSRPATPLRSMGLSLDSEMDLNDKLPVGKFINPTLRPKAKSTGGLNTKNTSIFDNEICDDTNNMYEVLNEHSKLSNNNNEENRNSSPNEYSHLFEYPSKEASNKLSEYNHLKRNYPPKPLPRPNKPGLQISPVSPVKNKKPLRPVRPPALQQPVYEIPRTK